MLRLRVTTAGMRLGQYHQNAKSRTLLRTVKNLFSCIVKKRSFGAVTCKKAWGGERKYSCTDSTQDDFLPKPVILTYWGKSLNANNEMQLIG